MDTAPLSQSKSDNTLLPQPVVFSFLSRPDATSLADRRRNPAHMLNKLGEPLSDVEAQKAENAFGNEEGINFEKWSEYWRKVHGPRFTYVEAPDDKSLAVLKRYDQLHRLPAGPSSDFPAPYEPPLDADNRLFPTVIGHIPQYRRPAWDGAAYLVFEHRVEIPVLFSSARVIEKILPEDRVIFRDIAPMIADQFILKEGKKDDEAVTLIKTHVRAQTMLDRDAFQSRWLKANAALFQRSPEIFSTVSRYVQLHNAGGTKPGEHFFDPDMSVIDGISLTSFSTVASLERFLTSNAYHELLEAEAAISEPSGGEFWTAINFSVIQD